MTCKELAQWITQNIEIPLEAWFTRAREQCTEASQWLEQRRTELEEWREQQEERCREQKCDWVCLCCNKWFCWLVDVLVRILTIVLEIIQHIIEAICTLIVTVIWITVSIVVQIIKWVVLAVVCILEALCQILVLVGAVALFVTLIAVVALVIPALAAVAVQVIPLAGAIGVAALIAARVLCRASWCRFFGAIGWALKWSIVVGAVFSLMMFSPLAALIVAIYGGLVAALSIVLERMPCELPHTLGLP